MTSLVKHADKERKLELLNRAFLQKLGDLIQHVPHMDLSNTFQNYQTQLNKLSSEKEQSIDEDFGLAMMVNEHNQDDNESNEANKLEKLLNNVLSGIISTQEETDKTHEQSIDTQTNSKYHITWHQYFMCVAQLAAKRSKDPSTQVGACIVNQQNKIVATGYNGMPNGVQDDLVPWTKEGPFLETKYAYVVHAELNAILNCVSTDQTGCRVYVSLFPCNECAKAIIQSGIRLVIYLSDKHRNKDATKAAKKMFQMAGVMYRQYFSLAA